MGKLTKEQQDQLAALEAARDAPDPDESDEVSWYERTKDGERGATMKASRAKTHGPQWLRDHLADREDPPADAGDDAGAQGAAAADGGTVKRFQRTVGRN